MELITIDTEMDNDVMDDRTKITDEDSHSLCPTTSIKGCNAREPTDNLGHRFPVPIYLFT